MVLAIWTSAVAVFVFHSSKQQTTAREGCARTDAIRDSFELPLSSSTAHLPRKVPTCLHSSFKTPFQSQNSENQKDNTL